MTTQLVHDAGLNQDQVDLIRRTICKGATDDELQLFIMQCNRTGLDPMSRQIHAVKRWDTKEGREVMAIQVGIDGFRLVAQRTGESDGQEGPFWCGSDGEWRDVWLTPDPPQAAKVIVHRKGHAHGYVGVARYRAYVQTKKDGSPNHFWGRMPDVMLAKVAESLALRKAFPQELSGLYSPEEMGDEHPQPKREPEHEPMKVIAEPQIDDAGMSTITEWSTWIEGDPSIDTINARLPDLKPMPKQIKGVIWGIISDRLTTHGYVFDGDTKKWIIPAEQLQG